ncbi:epoxide hydrolase 4-like [Babylonia areolata]|uniref:epoxide hydrolase 4-like n=1 Tax=Babylonia areolata TaxID=304850 RepID=UPI003FD5FAD5
MASKSTTTTNTNTTITMPLYAKLALWVVLFTTGAFFAGMSLLRLMLQVVRKGPARVFYTKKRPVPPACMQDPRLGVHGYAHLEDVRLHYVSNGDDNKPLMLLVHGFPEFWYSWRHQLREFKDTYRVVAVDMRGYGDSDRPSAVSDYTLDKLTKDLSQLITALGEEKCVMVGLDWGGVIAWAFALDYPHMLDSLVVINCASIPGYIRQLSSGLRQISKSWYISYFQMPWVPEANFQADDMWRMEQLFRGSHIGIRSDNMTEEDVEAYKYTCQRNGFTAPLNYYRALVRYPDILYRLSRPDLMVSCPTLLLFGLDDSALDPAIPSLSAKNVSGEAVVKFLEDCGHFSPMDRPREVNQSLRDFLKQTARR